MQESAVDQSAVDQSVLKKIWNMMTGEGGGAEDGPFSISVFVSMWF